MKYTTKQYANSLLSALEGKSAKAQGESLRRFFSILQRNGDASKRSQIMEEVRRTYFKKNGTHKVEVEMAANPPASLKKDIEGALGKKIVLSERLSPELVGGIKIFIDDETLVDASIKTQLDKLFTRTNKE